MNAISELKDDLTFLKKFDSKNKIWKDIDAPTFKGKAKVRSNFLLHPKRLSSESECSSLLHSPTQLSSETDFNKFNVYEDNNNNVEKVVSAMTETCKIKFTENYHREDGTGDRSDKKSLLLCNTKTIITAKKPTKVRPSTTICSTRVEHFDKKFKSLIERSLTVLTNIRLMIEKGIPLADGEEDYYRRLKRLQEFSSRFSRVYLYPLLRQTDELSVPERIGASALNQKILYAQQMVLQGLQAYYTHLPSSIGKCCSDKLRTLLEQCLHLCQLYDLLKKDANSENNEFIHAMRNHVELLLEALTNFDLRLVEKKSKTSESSTKKSKPQSKTQKPKSKLSMYTVNSAFRKDLELRRALESLAKKKFSVKSKYKTAGFKHRPPVEKQQGSSVPNKMKIFQKHSSGLLKNTPMKSPIREEDIKTMVELENELEAPPNTGENLNHENSIASSRLQLVQDSDRGIREEDNVEKALEVLWKFLGKHENMSNDFLQKIANEVNKQKEEQGRNDKSSKKLKDPVVTITGAKNAKLICIRDDNSLVEADDHRVDKEIMTDAEIKLTSSETQTELKREKLVRCRSGIKISRLPKTNRKMLKLLPKDYAINIIQYKLRYTHFHKHNPMYRKSPNIQPWVLMGRISDDILDYVLQSVTRELEVNEILENLYHAEFQY